MKLLNKLFILTATAIAISSCQGDLLDTKPYDKASSGSMWSNENFCTTVSYTHLTLPTKA